MPGPAWSPDEGEPLKTMQNISNDDLKQHLMQSNDEYKTLHDKHSEYERLIAEIEQKSHLSPEDEFEEHRLKKLKLHIKDQMQDIVNRSSATEVA
jgi:uncharacterized protein YdcH (DUF465 family)